jgi:hypothetical protein
MDLTVILGFAGNIGISSGLARAKSASGASRPSIAAPAKDYYNFAGLASWGVRNRQIRSIC